MTAGRSRLPHPVTGAGGCARMRQRCASVEHMFATLNEEQQAVVDFDGGPLRVIAGAGTGKTTALTARVAGLIERGTRPDRVLLLTFTRRAARQMMGRARAHTNERGRTRLFGGTFHSIAHQTLRRHAALLALPEGFS